MYKLPHDHDAAEHIGVPRLLFGLLFLTLGVYLAGLFKTDSGDAQRPRGTIYAWVESFLLPDTDAAKAGCRRLLDQARQCVRLAPQSRRGRRSRWKDNRLVFVDFTGTLCTNCKLNERNVFPLPQVVEGDVRRTLLKLYTDVVPAKAPTSSPTPPARRAAENHVHDVGVPHAILKPTANGFDIVRQYDEGLIGDVPAFVRFISE
ncbi:MAG: hypothetical protein U0736_01835 [Gemmataceae bacterium]